MPRQARLDAPGSLHHVIARGIERRKIFLGEVDYEDFVARLETVVTSTGAEVLAWSLLPNHFHLLVRTGGIGLPRIMRRLMTGYAVTFNRRHRRHGHLFQNRYKSIICEQETYLLELVRYIHLNSVRARLVRNVEGLAEYPWSGHGVLMGRTERPWQAVDAVLGHFGSERGVAQLRYESFVWEGVQEGRGPELVGGGLRRSSGAVSEAPRRRRRKDEEQAAFDERILGGSEFVREVLREAEWEGREKLRRSARGMTIEWLGSLVAQLAGITQEDLRAGNRRPAAVEARRALAQVAMGELGRPGASVARYLGVASSTVNRHAAVGEASTLTRALLEAVWKEV